MSPTARGSLGVSEWVGLHLATRGVRDASYCGMCMRHLVTAPACLSVHVCARPPARSASLFAACSF